MPVYNYRTILVVLLGAAVLVLALIIFYQRRRRRSTDRTKYVDALHALINRKKDDALRLLTQAVKSGETDIDAYIQLGSLLREKGYAEKAFQIHRGLTVRRDLAYEEEKTIKIEIAEDLVELGKKDKAVSILNSITDRSKEPEALLRLHTLYHRCGEYDRAFSVLKSLASVDDSIGSEGKAAYLASVAATCIDNGDNKYAEKYITRSLREDGHCVPAMYLSGRIHMEENENEKAAAVWQKLIEADIRFFSEVLPMLEKVLYESGRFDRLVGILENLYENNGDNPAVGIALASIYEKMGQHDRCVAILEEQRKYIGNDKDLILKLADVYLQSGRLNQARKILEEYDSAEDGEHQWICEKCSASYEYPLEYCLECSGIGTIHK